MTQTDILLVILTRRTQRKARADQRKMSGNSGNRKNVSHLRKVASAVITLYGLYAKTISGKRKDFPKITAATREQSDYPHNTLTQTFAEYLKYHAVPIIIVFTYCVLALLL